MEVDVFDPEKYYIDLDDLSSSPVVWEFKDLIGRKKQKNILRGIEPVFVGKEEELVYFKRSPDVTGMTKSPNKAVLFVGEKGNGKKTLDSAFAVHMFERVLQNEKSPIKDFRYYEISLKDMLAKKNKETVENINACFDKIEEMADKEEYEAFLLYISFGDITKLLSADKIADAVAYRINRLLKKDSLLLLLTASATNPPEKIPVSVRKTFIPMILELPSDTERKEYFEYFSEMNPSVEWVITEEKLVSVTKDFTYLMLEHLIDQIYLWVQGELMVKYSDSNDLPVFQSYLKGEASEHFRVLPKVFEEIAESIRKEAVLYTEKKSANIIYQPAAAPVTQTFQKSEAVVENTNDEKSKIRKDDKGNEYAFNTIKDMNEFVSSLPAPIVLKTGGSENNIITEDEINDNIEQLSN